MDIRPPRKIVITPRGKGHYMIFLYRYILSGTGEWKLVDELIRCPKKQTEAEALQAARKECIKYGIVTEPEVKV